MRYLTLAADYAQSALRENDTGAVLPEEVGLPEELGRRVRDWNGRYRALIPLSMAERAEPSTAARVKALDEEGLALAREMAQQGQALKVRYYSEGLLRYLS